MFCANCGETLKVGARFCADCGQRVKDGTELIVAPSTSLTKPQKKNKLPKPASQAVDINAWLESDSDEVPFTLIEDSEARAELLDKLRNDAELALKLAVNSTSHTNYLREVFRKCKKALALDPNDTTFLVMKADALSQSERFDEALREYEKALRLPASFIAPYNTKAYVLVQQAMLMYIFNRQSEALSFYNQAAGMVPDLFKSHFDGYNCLRQSPLPARRAYKRFQKEEFDLNIHSIYD